MRKAITVLSLIIGVKCQWDPSDPFLNVTDATKFPFTTDRDVSGNVKCQQNLINQHSL